MAKITKEIDGKICVTSAFLADAFGVTTKTLAEWEKKGCPKAARGYWVMADVIKWRDDKINGKAAESLEEMSPIQQKIYWETRCKEAQAENQQFKNAVLRGDYLEKAQVKKELTDFFMVLKQSMLSVPRKVALTSAQYIGKERAREVESDVMGVMIYVLEQWSGGEIKPIVDRGRSKDAKAARTDNSNGVGRQRKNTRQKKQ